MLCFLFLLTRNPYFCINTCKLILLASSDFNIGSCRFNIAVVSLFQENYGILGSMFALSLFVHFIHYLTSRTTLFKYRFSRIKSFDYFVCFICRYGLDQALFH